MARTALERLPMAAALLLALAPAITIVSASIPLPANYYKSIVEREAQNIDKSFPVQQVETKGGKIEERGRICTSD